MLLLAGGGEGTRDGDEDDLLVGKLCVVSVHQFERDKLRDDV